MGIMNIRTPWQHLSGCIWLARLTDKARLMSQGNLPRDYLMLLGHPRGIDGHFVRHFGLDRNTTLEAVQLDDSSVERWFLVQPGVTEASIQTWNELAPNLGRRGWPGQEEFALVCKHFFGKEPSELPAESFFELIRLDESDVTSASLVSRRECS